MLFYVLFSETAALG